MGVAINEQMGGMPPNGANPMGIPGVQQMCPEVQHQMAGQMPQLPPMNTNQQMQQMHYTIREALRPYLSKINSQDKQIRELRVGLRAHEKRFQETESNRGSMTLDFGKMKAGNTLGKTIKEMNPLLMNEGIPYPAPKNFIKAKTEDARNHISKVNDAMNTGPGIL